MIRPYVPADLAAVGSLLTSNGWQARAADLGRLEQIVESATTALVVEVDGLVVGFGRCLTDGTSNGYLSMIVIDAGSRRQGWGRKLVAALTGEDPTVTWVLRAGHAESEPFWESMGFRRSEIAFERNRTI